MGSPCDSVRLACNLSLTAWLGLTLLACRQIAASKQNAAEAQTPVRVLPFLPSVLQENGRCVS